MVQPPSCLDRGKMTRPILGQSSTRQEWRGWTMSMTVLGPKLIWCTQPSGGTFRDHHLYPREVVARYQFGSVLFYRHDTWHRGRPVKPGARRLVQNITFTKLGRDWLNVLHPGWSWSMYRKDKLMEKLVAQATVEQRVYWVFRHLGMSIGRRKQWQR